MSSQAAKKVIPGKESGLPNPYSKDFDRAEDSISNTMLDYESAERHRIKYGRLASNSVVLMTRRVAGLLMAMTALAGVIAPEHPLTRPTLMILLWIPMLVISIAPAFIAGERGMTSLVLRSSLWKQEAIVKGTRRDMMAEPGMDRIKAGLNDVRLHNATASILGAASLFLLILAAGLEPSGLAYNLVLLISLTSSLALSFHAIFTTDDIRKLGDDLPYLVLHSPTHHPMKLDTILGDLVFAHLDPDHSLLWNLWEDKLAYSLLPGVDKMQARERILYLLHLNNRGNLDDEQTLSELKEFIKPMAIQELLLDEDAKFNWVRLQRLISHARAWQVEVFDLLDRLQNDLLAGSATITKDPWRMDMALAAQCNNRTGHLFIALNNQTNEDRHLRVEVIVPGGMPENQVHRFELTSCPGPEGAVKITDSLVEDALDWMPKYLEKGVILWIGVAWEESVRGRRNVQVILRDDDNTVLDSRIIKTEVLAGESTLSRQRLKRMLEARSVGESSLPALEVSTAIP
ncbi:MAG: hypothetical protein DWC06_03035 [Candidatus Poseidoniales archaeon]|nr:MAG: hypothetical protein DWC06_03035 [Candidatus Poseidoniales archaeon]